MKSLMRGMSRLLFLVIGGATALTPAPSVADDKNFYAGNTINIIVGCGPGGGYDLYARLLAQHLGKHIPGHPSVVVQNMAGAGGVRAANYVYAAAPKYGTVIAAVNQFAPMFQLLGTPAADKKRLVFPGGHSGPRTEMIRESLLWLDHYLGEVKR